ncbi:hypothetical protein U0070_014438 [Myodes glareolus]|uniref:Uncharacterized protein n=1 Tax=Myodes glareolus TaxID=447135 RepID=A0AAW0J6B5_MYOGA
MGPLNIHSRELLWGRQQSKVNGLRTGAEEQLAQLEGKGDPEGVHGRSGPAFLWCRAVLAAYRNWTARAEETEETAMFGITVGSPHKEDLDFQLLLKTQELWWQSYTQAPTGTAVSWVEKPLPSVVVKEGAQGSQDRKTQKMLAWDPGDVEEESRGRGRAQ